MSKVFLNNLMRRVGTTDYKAHHRLGDYMALDIRFLLSFLYICWYPCVYNIIQCFISAAK